MQLSPGEYFTIVRQLPDPNDSATYYVRAVIRDARTDELMESVNLTDQGSRRFSKPWIVRTKRDDGFYIAIATTVYTDSGYTTKSDIYAEEMETYLVEMRSQHFGGGGSSISYKKVKEMVLEALKEAEKEPEAPIDVKSIIQAVVDGATRDLKAHLVDMLESSIKEPETVDLAPVLKGIDGIAKTGDLITKVLSEMPDIVREDFIKSIAGLSDSIERVKKGIVDAHREIRTVADANTNNHTKLIDEIKVSNNLSMQEKLPADMARKIEAVVREGFTKTTTEDTPVDWQKALRDVMKTP